jgi:hypothetical protein
MDLDKIIINGKELDFFVIDYYDGIKESANLSENILLLWQNSHKTHETWFQMKPSDVKFLIQYLSNEIGLLSLINQSDISLIKRYYKTYNSLSEPSTINKESDLIPKEDIFLGFDMIIIKKNIKKNTFHTAHKKQSYNILL